MNVYLLYYTYNVLKNRCVNNAKMWRHCYKDVSFDLTLIHVFYELFNHRFTFWLDDFAHDDIK
jgi:hypothetical protein